MAKYSMTKQPKINAHIHYKLSVHNTSEHLFKVTMTAKVKPSKNLSLSLPTWIPGSYMVRDFARNLHALRSTDPEIKIEQIDKQTWKLHHSSKQLIESVELEYDIYAFDLSVRSAFINDEYAFYNGTSVFLRLHEYENCEHSVSIEAVDPSHRIASSMPVKSAANNLYTSSDYYDLIEHPGIIGDFEHHSFDVQGYTFHLVFTGKHRIDFDRLQTDLIPIINHHIDLFGEFPCPEYWFLTLVSDQGFGGLEHTSSTVLQYSRFELPLKQHKTISATTEDAENKPKLEKTYQQFLSLCSHELFHTWHVKRIKPEVMHKPNLNAEVYTEQLWIYEGFTSLYDDLSLVRAKVISPDDYLQILNEVITRLLKTPGRFRQSVAQSSFEAWSKFYKQDAGSNNHIVSYYNKGTVVALCLDISLRLQSNNKVSLDTIMQDLWQEFGKPEIGTPNDVIASLCKNKHGINLDNFLHLATQTTHELPLPSLLENIGLTLNVRASNNFSDKGGVIHDALEFDIGASFTNHAVANNGSGLKVTSIQHNRASSKSGLQVGDIIIAFDNWCCDENKFIKVLQQHALGDNIPLHVLRDGRLLELTFVVENAVADVCNLEIHDRKAFETWLGL